MQECTERKVFSSLTTMTFHDEKEMPHSRLLYEKAIFNLFKQFAAHRLRRCHMMAVAFLESFEHHWYTCQTYPTGIRSCKRGLLLVGSCMLSLRRSFPNFDKCNAPSFRCIFRRTFSGTTITQITKIILPNMKRPKLMQKASRSSLVCHIPGLATLSGV